MKIQFSWATPYTAPQNSTSYNLETIYGDPDDFGADEAAEYIRKHHPSLCDGEDGQVRIGGIWYTDKDGHEVMVQELLSSGHNWA